MVLLKYNELRCVFSRGFASRIVFPKSIPLLEPHYIPLNLFGWFFPRNHFYYRLQLPIDEVGQSINTLNATKLQGEKCPL